MLDQAEINVGRLLFWMGMSIGICLLVANIFMGGNPALGPMGIAVLMLSCTHAVRRSVVSHDQALRDAFELGRDHERLQSVRSL